MGFSEVQASAPVYGTRATVGSIDGVSPFRDGSGDRFARLHNTLVMFTTDNGAEVMSYPGYVTASLASFFVGRDADDDRATLAGKASVKDLQGEILALREEVRNLASRLA